MRKLTHLAALAAILFALLGTAIPAAAQPPNPPTRVTDFQVTASQSSSDPATDLMTVQVSGRGTVDVSELTYGEPPATDTLTLTGSPTTLTSRGTDANTTPTGVTVRAGQKVVIWAYYNVANVSTAWCGGPVTMRLVRRGTRYDFYLTNPTANPLWIRFTYNGQQTYTSAIEVRPSSTRRFAGQPASAEARLSLAQIVTKLSKCADMGWDQP